MLPSSCRSCCHGGLGNMSLNMCWKLWTWMLSGLQRREVVFLRLTVNVYVGEEQWTLDPYRLWASK